MAYISEQKDTWLLSGDLLMDSASIVLAESALLPMGDFLNVDFSKVNNVDTSTLGLMMEWVRRAKAEFCQIGFSNMPDSLKSLAQLYSVQDFFRVQ
jgi:ABC-type transporter Mla MlaB component